jgi:hypothetical protein
MVVMRKIRLPKFDKNCVVEEQRALVFDGQCKYDVIFGVTSCPKLVLTSSTAQES